MDTLDNLTALIEAHTIVDADLIESNYTLHDLGLDSLDIIELVLDVEELFDIDIPQIRMPKPATSIAELHDLIQTLQAA
jgi:acyl carrier protein